MIKNTFQLLLLATFALQLQGCRGSKNSEQEREPLVYGAKPTYDIEQELQDQNHFLADVNHESEIATSTFDFTELYTPYSPGLYRFAPGDVVEVSVFGHPDTLAEAVPIAPDGKLYYMFLNGVSTTGRTINEVSDEMEKQLESFFTNGEVCIIPKQIRSQTYTVMGEVEKPGQYLLDTAVTLRQAIGRAEGLPEELELYGTNLRNCSLKDSYLIRNGKKIPFDLGKALTSNQAQDIYLRPNDFIFIAPAGKDQVFRIGAVSESRAITFQDGMTLQGVLAESSGDFTNDFLPNANINQILLIRGDLNSPQVYPINLQNILLAKQSDIYLLPGDIIFVPFNSNQTFNELVEQALLTYTVGFAMKNQEDSYE